MSEHCHQGKQRHLYKAWSMGKLNGIKMADMSTA